MILEVGRREFIAALGGAVVSLPGVAHSQQAGRVFRIGMQWHAGSEQEEVDYLGAFRSGLRELGYVEGQNVVLELRFPNEQADRFFSQAAELAQLKVDVLVAAGKLAAIACQRATTTIPIVFGAVPDPVGSKLVANLARPGGNITGFSNMARDLTAKRLEILKETVVGLSRAALLVNLNDPEGSQKYIEEGETAARHLGITVQAIGIRGATDLEDAFSKMVEDQLQGIVVTVDGLFYAQRKRVALLAQQKRLPTITYTKETLIAGALISYGPNQVTMFRRSAAYVDRILKGEKPADLPVDQPTVFELIVNRPIAEAIGLPLPPSILARADEVIE